MYYLMKSINHLALFGLKVFIVDDHPEAIDQLKKLSKTHCPEFNITGFANSVNEAVKLIPSHNPELLFLDVELPDGFGFDVLEKLDVKPKMVVFVTAHADYAIRAFRANAIDYMLKPVDEEELKVVYEKVLQWRDMLDKSEQLQNQYHENILKTAEEHRNNTEPSKLVIRNSDGFTMIDQREITHINADGSYSHVVLSDDKSVIISKPISDVEKMLNIETFFRIHRSHIINLSHLESYMSKEMAVELSTGTTLPVSRRRQSDFAAVLKSLNKN